MDSFAFFYEGSNINETGIKCRFLKKFFKSKSKDINADLHFNVWSLEKDNIFIDIGIKIYKTNGIKKIFIYVPFLIEDEKKEIEDLSEKLLDIKTANLIFNTDCNIDKENVTADGVTYKIIDLEDKIEVNKKNKYNRNNSIIKIELNDVNINNNNIYIRFRIKNKNIKDSIMFTPKSPSDFTSPKKNIYKIIDIKINKKRNFPYDKLNNKYTLFSFNKIHFLLMEDIYSDINFLSKDIYEVRILEKDWSSYLGIENINNIIVFHYKNKSEKEKIEDCSIVIKVINKKQNLILLFIYTLFALLISAMPSFLTEFVNIFYIFLTVSSLFVILVIFYLKRKW